MASEGRSGQESGITDYDGRNAEIQREKEPDIDARNYKHKICCLLKFLCCLVGVNMTTATVWDKDVQVNFCCTLKSFCVIFFVRHQARDRRKINGKLSSL